MYYYGYAKTILLNYYLLKVRTKIITNPKISIMVILTIYVKKLRLIEFKNLAKEDLGTGICHATI